MRTRRFQLPLAAVLGLAVAILPGVASSETSPTVEAVNVGPYSHNWSPTQVSIATGGTVTLSNPTTVAHGVEWVGGPATPSCEAGVPVGTTSVASGTKWSGACTFSQAGTYTFYCTIHGPEMTGTVTVSADGTTTTTMSTPTSSTTSTPAPGATPPVANTEAEPGAPIFGALSLRAIQHGGTVKGSLAIAKTGAGARLEVDVFARRGALGRTKGAATVMVGHLQHGSVVAGKASFTVALDSSARRALKRRGRLALTVKLALVSPAGKRQTLTRSVIQHP